MYDDLSEPKKKAEVAEQYRKVLLKSESGRAMFTHMLAELGVMEDTRGKSERELGRYDYAIRLLNIMCIPSYPNLHQFVNAMRKWPTEYPKQEEDGEVAEAKKKIRNLVGGEGELNGATSY